MSISNSHSEGDKIVQPPPGSDGTLADSLGGFAATTLRSSRNLESEGALIGSPLIVHTRRRDGERPLGIVAAIVALLSLDLDVTAALHTHDWRPIAFYTAFCALAAAAAVILALQWRNEKLLIGMQGLVHHDWLRRPTLYSWADVTSAVEHRRPENTRLLLQIRKSRTFVLHDDWPPYPTAVQVCKERLASIGTNLVED